MRGYSGSAFRNTLICLVLLLVAALPLMAQAQKAPSPYKWVETMAGTNQLHGVQWDGQQFVAVGDKGAIFTSADGLKWAPKASGTAASVNGVASGGKTLMAVGQQGLLLQSPDAGSWSNVSGTTSDLSAVAYGQISKKAGLYVAVGPQGTVITSRDGSSWTAVLDLSTTSDLNGIFYGGPKGAQRFVAVGNAGAVLTSANGTTWNEFTARDLGPLRRGLWRPL